MVPFAAAWLGAAPGGAAQQITFRAKLVRDASPGSPEPRAVAADFKREALWFNFPVPVCWDLSPADYEKFAALRGTVKDAVAATWATVSDASFSGWNRCTSGAPANGFSLTVHDAGPHANGLGTEIEGMNDAIVFNFTYKNWNASCRTQLDYCSRLIAIHEFGHALGLADEQGRADAPRGSGPDGKPAICTADGQGATSDVPGGRWDSRSVMDYCSPQWNGDGNLSATDIATIDRMYGAPSKPLAIKVLQWPSRLIAGNCEVDGAALELRENGTAVFTADSGTLLALGGETQTNVQLKLADGRGSALETMNLAGPATPGLSSWESDLIFPAEDFAKAKGATLALDCGGV